jgi:hypothetical protein
MDKKSWSERVNERLQESPGEIFQRGKWRFWFPLVIGLTFLNGLLTAWIFGAGVQTYIGLIVATVGALLCWLSVGNLHYSDSEDPQLARGVSLLDSITLCFVIAHFCFLLWANGHLITVRGAEEKYDAAALAYNERQEKIQADNTKISADAVKIAEANVRAKRLENDTAYWTAKAGLRVGGKAARNQGSGQGSDSPSLATAPIELEKPKAPDESSAAFLSRWDAWIRAANFGELILAAITLIYIRNRSAKFNAQSAPERILPVATMSLRGASVKPALKANSAQKATLVATDPRQEALYALRDHLRVISSGLYGRFFKADLIDGGVSIRLCKKVLGADKTIAKTRQSDKLLAAVDRPDFRERLVGELARLGFPIGKGGE